MWRGYPLDAGQELKLGWTGSYLVVNKISPLTYSFQKSLHARPLIIHVDHNKPYKGQHPLENTSILTEDNMMKSHMK